MMCRLTYNGSSEYPSGLKIYAVHWSLHVYDECVCIQCMCVHEMAACKQSISMNLFWKLNLIVWMPETCARLAHL